MNLKITVFECFRKEYAYIFPDNIFMVLTFVTCLLPKNYTTPTSEQGLVVTTITCLPSSCQRAYRGVMNPYAAVTVYIRFQAIFRPINATYC